MEKRIEALEHRVMWLERANRWRIVASKRLGRLEEKLAMEQEAKELAAPYVAELREWLKSDAIGMGDYLDDLHRLLDILDPDSPDVVGVPAEKTEA